MAEPNVVEESVTITESTYAPPFGLYVGAAVSGVSAVNPNSALVETALSR
jgi:hypothetical protein